MSTFIPPVMTAAKSAAVIKGLTAQLARSASRQSASIDAVLNRCAVHAQRFGDARLASPIFSLLAGTAKNHAVTWYRETTGHSVSTTGAVGARESEPNPALLGQSPTRYESETVRAAKLAAKTQRESEKAKAARVAETATRAAQQAERDRQTAQERDAGEIARLTAELRAVGRERDALRANWDTLQAERDAFRDSLEQAVAELAALREALELAQASPKTSNNKKRAA